MQDPRIVWRIDLLGGTSGISRDGAVIARFQNPKSDALLAYLAYFSGHPHPRDLLADRFWPDVGSDVSLNRLSLTIARLRRKFETGNQAEEGSELRMESLLIADRTSVALNKTVVVVDVFSFEEALATARAAVGIDARIAAVEIAVGSYRGELLPGFYDDWVIDERRRLEEDYLTARLTLARLLRERSDEGDIGKAEEHARAVVSADRTREDAHLELMRIFDVTERHVEALREFNDLKQALREVFDAVPGREIVDLVERIRTRASVGSRSQHLLTRRPMPMRRSWAAPPAPLTRFFGREREIQQVSEMVAQGRLITLLGVGGSGKTRLAIEVANHLRAVFEDAIAFVSLANLADPRLVPMAVSDALRLGAAAAGEDETVARIVEVIAPFPRALLILDNLEHLMDAEGASLLPGFVRRLLEALPNLTVILTSRQRLNVEGERELSVPPLPAFAESGNGLKEAPGVQLFVDRAAAVRPDFRLTDANLPIVTRLCERLEGIPLAIELCAAWAQSLTPEQMAIRLEDRFALLVSRRTDLPARHRTLTAAIEYSYDLLPESLRRIFLQVSVFRGGWTLDAVGAIFSADATAMSLLRDHSLILADDTAEPGNGLRFRQLESLREFAVTQMTGDERDRARSDHAGYFLGLAETAKPHLNGRDQSVWLERLQEELDNLRAATQWYTETRDTERGLRLATSLHRFWNVRGHQLEGLDWIRQLEDDPQATDIEPQLRARVQRVKSIVMHSLGDNQRALETGERALALSEQIGDVPGVAGALMAIGNAANFTGDTGRARDAYERSLAIGRALGNDDTTAGSLNNLGLTKMHESRWEDAAASFQEALAIFRKIGHRNYQATVLVNMAMAARQMGDLDQAFDLLIEALAIHRSLSSRQVSALINLGAVSRLRQDYSAARAFLLEGVTVASETGQKYVLIGAIRETGLMDVAEQFHERGLYLLGATEALRVPLKITFATVDPAEMDAAQLIAREAMGNSLAEAAWQSGRHALLHQVVARAVEANSPKTTA